MNNHIFHYLYMSDHNSLCAPTLKLKPRNLNIWREQYIISVNESMRCVSLNNCGIKLGMHMLLDNVSIKFTKSRATLSCFLLPPHLFQWFKGLHLNLIGKHFRAAKLITLTLKTNSKHGHMKIYVCMYAWSYSNVDT